MTFESLTSTLILNPASVLSPGQWLWSSFGSVDSSVHSIALLQYFN